MGEPVKADTDWLIKLGDSEPPDQCPDGVSLQVYFDAIDAWDKAHPEILVEREAAEKAEFARWKVANPKKLAAIIKAVMAKPAKPLEVEHVTEAAIMREIDNCGVDYLEETSVEELAEDIFSSIMSDARRAADKAKRIKREMKNPAAALERAREVEQREAMNEEKAEAKAEARENGEAWGDVKDEWEADWLADNWDAEAEAAFIVSFEAQWLQDHGTPHPAAIPVVSPVAPVVSPAVSPKAREVIDADQLLANVYVRLYADDGEDRHRHELMLPHIALMIAKQQAKNGDFGPLKKLYPQIADILDLVKPPNKKRVRRDPSTPFLQGIREHEAGMVRRIRQILEEETKLKRVPNELVVKIAAKILNPHIMAGPPTRPLPAFCTPNDEIDPAAELERAEREIRDIIRRGH